MQRKFVLTSVFTLTYIRGGLADGLNGGVRGWVGFFGLGRKIGGGAGIGPSRHIIGVSLVLDVGVVQGHGGGGGTAVNDG